MRAILIRISVEIYNILNKRNEADDSNPDSEYRPFADCGMSNFNIPETKPLM